MYRRFISVYVYSCALLRRVGCVKGRCQIDFVAGIAYLSVDASRCAALLVLANTNCGYPVRRQNTALNGCSPHVDVMPHISYLKRVTKMQCVGGAPFIDL